MNLNIQNQRIIVTGGAKGIGQAIAKALAAEGAIPIIIGRSEIDNQATVDGIRSLGGQSFSVTAELDEPKACKEAIVTITDKYGGIDGLVNNAGLNDSVGLENGNYADFVSSLHRNLIHYYMMAHYTLPELKKSKGSILNISSKTAETGQGETSGYAAANGGRNALTREWAVELLKYGIRVNCIVVAECWTPQYEKWINSLPDAKEKMDDITSRIPLGNRMTTAKEIADMAVFLLSGRSSHTTGQIIHVDGGYVHLDRALARG